MQDFKIQFPNYAPKALFSTENSERKNVLQWMGNNISIVRMTLDFMQFRCQGLGAEQRAQILAIKLAEALVTLTNQILEQAERTAAVKPQPADKKPATAILAPAKETLAKRRTYVFLAEEVKWWPDYATDCLMCHCGNCNEIIAVPARTDQIKIDCANCQATHEIPSDIKRN